MVEIGRVRVKVGNAPIEQKISAYPPQADICAFVSTSLETKRAARRPSQGSGRPKCKREGVAEDRFGSRLCENLTDAMIPLLNRGGMMKGFVQGADRQQTTLLPECLDDWVEESNPVRAVDVFVDALELRELGFDGVTPAATGLPGYHPSAMLKRYIYGYLNPVQSRQRLEPEG